MKIIDSKVTIEMDNGEAGALSNILDYFIIESKKDKDYQHLENMIEVAKNLKDVIDERP
jgi:hypothetical protein